MQNALWILLSFFLSTKAFANEWYFSWGYSKDYWSPSDIHVSQPSLGNNFTVHGVQAVDYPQWNTGIWNKDPTDPQFNVRIGYFFNAAQTLAVELNYDHTKYSSVLDQTAHITGYINGNYVDTYSKLTSDYFHYDLHNGANHIMLNIVKRIPLIKETSQDYSLAGMLKFGAGIMMPHAENTIFGNNNSVGSKQFNNLFGMHTGWWQLNGWTIGAEVGLRFQLTNPLYLEFTDKEAYASLSNVSVYEGTASQNLWVNELILSLGISLDRKQNSI